MIHKYTYFGQIRNSVATVYDMIFLKDYDAGHGERPVIGDVIPGQVYTSFLLGDSCLVMQYFSTKRER